MPLYPTLHPPPGPKKPIHSPVSDLLHYSTLEEAPAGADWIVFIHGAGGSSLTWKYQTEALKPHYRLLLIDMRDHGYSKHVQPAHDRARRARQR